MEPRLHRCRGYLQQRGCLLDAQALDGAGDEDKAKGFRKRIGRLLDEVKKLSLCSDALRIGGRRGKRKLDDLRFRSPDLAGGAFQPLLCPKPHQG